NVFIGENAGDDGSLSGAYQNVGVGYASLSELTTGDQNIAVGAYSMYYNTTGSFNVAIGDEALMDNTVGKYSVAVGYSALEDANRTADVYAQNTAVGYLAGNDGQNDITTGQYNVFIGARTAASVNTAVNQIVIGYDANGRGNNYAVIGDGNITRVYASDDVGATLYAGSSTVQTSDRRIKENIEDLDYGLEFINKVRPVRYNKKRPIDYPADIKATLYPDGDIREISDEEQERTRIGFIAQEVRDVMQELNLDGDIVEFDESTTIYSIAYPKIVAPLVKAVQELTVRVEELERKVAIDRVEASQD
ncbi:uncharacterized protein METZ01_LOCUS354100, partial [marine metagenome]